MSIKTALSLLACLATMSVFRALDVVAIRADRISYAYDNLKFVDRPWEAVDHKLAATMSG